MYNHRLGRLTGRPARMTAHHLYVINLSVFLLDLTWLTCAGPSLILAESTWIVFALMRFKKVSYEPLESFAVSRLVVGHLVAASGRNEAKHHRVPG
jgi:hypothetical protein